MDSTGGEEGNLKTFWCCSSFVFLGGGGEGGIEKSYVVTFWRASVSI